MVKMEIVVDTGFASCQHRIEFDSDEIEGWDEMTQEEKDKAMEEPIHDVMNDCIDVWYEVIE